MPPRRRNPFDIYNRAARAPLRRPATNTAPIDLPVTAHRRYALEQIEAGNIRWYPSTGWRMDGTSCNSLIPDFRRAGWILVQIDKSHPTIELTDRGRQALIQ